MPNTTSNIVLYATAEGFPETTLLANATAANTTTIISTGISKASLLTDVLFRSASAAATNFNIIICPTGQQATAKYSIVQISVPANSGNNGSTAIASLAALVPSLFKIDLAGNRVLRLEGSASTVGEYSLYVQNTAITAGAITITALKENY